MENRNERSNKGGNKNKEDGGLKWSQEFRMKKECIFFFQAEDGIRDYKVTGVQTCALPIYLNISLFTWSPAL